MPLRPKSADKKIEARNRAGRWRSRTCLTASADTASPLRQRVSASRLSAGRPLGGFRAAEREPPEIAGTRLAKRISACPSGGGGIRTHGRPFGRQRFSRSADEGRSAQLCRSRLAPVTLGRLRSAQMGRNPGRSSAPITYALALADGRRSDFVGWLAVRQWARLHAVSRGAGSSPRFLPATGREIAVDAGSRANGSAREKATSRDEYGRRTRRASRSPRRSARAPGTLRPRPRRPRSGLPPRPRLPAPGP